MQPLLWIYDWLQLCETRLQLQLIKGIDQWEKRGDESNIIR